LVNRSTDFILGVEVSKCEVLKPVALLQDVERHRQGVVPGLHHEDALWLLSELAEEDG
jgi:hypothetical protein